MAGYMRIEEDQANIMHMAIIADVKHEDALSSNDDDDDNDMRGPGRGFTRSGDDKMGYVRQKGKGDIVYVEAMEHFIKHLFNSLTGTKAS